MAQGASEPPSADTAPGYSQKVRRSTSRRWQPASPAAPPGFWGDNASGRSFLVLLGVSDERFIGPCVHQIFHLGWIRQLYFDQPTRIVRVAVDRLGRIVKRAVDLRDFARHRRINLAA